ncbi:MAG: tRNA preQ1(34) S-adenosylmethionine ribosyltransferase-isomerase QueA [bacterium]
MTNLSLFDYYLPKENIAQEPCLNRDESKLMVLNRKNKTIEHKVFREILQYFSAGDILVLNNTKVIQCRLIGKKQTGGQVDILLYEKIKNNLYKILIKGKTKENTQIFFEKNICGIIKKENNENLIEFNQEIDLEKIGLPPLPPYIKKKMKYDKERYQTIYATHNGSIAAPTAGLHFTQELFQEIKKKKVEILFITLHINRATFTPIKKNIIEDHKMHQEYFEVTEEVASKINKAKKNNNRIFAVGTTTARALESCDYENDEIKASTKMTNLFIYPPYEFKTIDALITNFHLPKSSLLLLVSAFASRDFIFNTYEQAIKFNYQFFSYGDAQLIL